MWSGFWSTRCARFRASFWLLEGLPIDRSKVVKKFLSEGAAGRLQIEQLPSYAPELNPNEGIWKHLKHMELKNVCCRGLSELRRELRKVKERLRHNF